MKKTGMIAIGALIVAIFAPFTVVSGGGGMEDETFYNDKGLTHYNRAYYDYLASGKTEQAGEEFEKAAEAFLKAVKINDRFVEAYRNLGRVYTVQKKDELAVEAYRKVVALDPENVENYLPLASALQRTGKCGEARDVLARAKSLAADPAVRDALDKMIEKMKDLGER
ncbi:MAG TPA: tetratricopeptide repeat protein [Syntrophales bacterium]|nr:tetratricopeptide repeat protein [Syntrophales bacterium]